MNKPLVIKIGGAILDAQNDDQSAPLNQLFQIISQLKSQPIVIVHGGGSTVDTTLAQSGFETKKQQGLRITPKEQIPVIAGALAGNVNKTIVASGLTQQLAVVGLSLCDGQMVSCQLDKSGLGQVGIPSPHSSNLLDHLLKGHFLPIISSIGALNNGELVNVNADDAAVAICQLLNAELLLLTDVNGVKDEDSQYLSSLDEDQAQQLIAKGVIAGGMVAKVNAAFAAASKLRRSIAVASWKSPEQILTLLNGESIGTRILPSC